MTLPFGSVCLKWCGELSAKSAVPERGSASRRRVETGEVTGRADRCGTSALLRVIDPRSAGFGFIPQIGACYRAALFTGFGRETVTRTSSFEIPKLGGPEGTCTPILPADNGVLHN